MQFLDLHYYGSVGYALLGGIIPSLIWLYFWNREDNKNPEPKKMILLAFLGGVAAVFISLYLEKAIYGKIIILDHFPKILKWFKDFSIEQNIELSRVLLVAVYAPIIEEVAKFLFAFVLALRSKADDEPMDPIIYMITVALGFAAIENALFLIDPIFKNNLITSVITGNMRFIGATLLHTVSSATLGIFISFNFFDRKYKQTFWGILGLCAAIIVHSLFNRLMIQNSNTSFIALELIWIAVIVILLAFEKIKRIRLEKI